MAAAITTGQVAAAAAELGAMKRSLAKWLKFRTINDQVLSGTLTQVKLKKPLPYAQRAIASGRDMALEQDLATKLSVLLSEVMPEAQLPVANVAQNPAAAVQLAQIALAGQAIQAASPQSQGSAHPWLWPVLIVGGLLLAVTTAIKSAADVAKDHEEKACIEAGACTDYGFWLKVGGLTAIAWFAWRELGLGAAVKSYVAKRRS